MFTHQLAEPDDESSLYPYQGPTMPLSWQKENPFVEVSEKEECNRHKVGKNLAARTSGYYYTQIFIHTKAGSIDNLETHNISKNLTEPTHNDDQGDHGFAFRITSVFVI